MELVEKLQQFLYGINKKNKNDSSLYKILLGKCSHRPAWTKGEICKEMIETQWRKIGESFELF